MAHYGGRTQYARNALRDAQVNKTAVTFVQLYLHLWTTELDINDANGVEVPTAGSTGYICPAVTLVSNGDGSLKNSGVVRSPASPSSAGATFGTPVAFTLEDSATPAGGNKWWRGLLTAPTKEITAGDFFQIEDAGLVLNDAQTVT